MLVMAVYGLRGWEEVPSNRQARSVTALNANTFGWWFDTPTVSTVHTLTPCSCCMNEWLTGTLYKVHFSLLCYLVVDFAFHLASGNHGAHNSHTRSTHSLGNVAVTYTENAINLSTVDCVVWCLWIRVVCVALWIWIGKWSSSVFIRLKHVVMSSLHCPTIR